jgi:hypothetical protein
MWGLLALTKLCMPVVGKPQNPQYVSFPLTLSELENTC